MSKLQVGRGAAFLYIENLSTLVYGYAFWYMLSKITTPDIIGTSSSLISLATIFVSIASIGIPVGLQRFLGKMFLEEKFEDVKLFVHTSLIIVTAGIFACCITLLFARSSLAGIHGDDLVVVMISLIISSTLSICFRYILIASLDTKKLLLISIFSSGIKLILAVVLVFTIPDVLAVMISFTATPALTAILIAIALKSRLKGFNSNLSHKFSDTGKALLKASVVTWIPMLTDTIGAQLGTIIVLGIQGPSQAAFYFIAFQITLGIAAVIWALESVVYPVLSTINSERKLYLWRVIKIGLIVVLPLSSSALFCSEDIMQVFGYKYKDGAVSLQLLLLSIVPTAVSAGIGILMYSYGNYREVLVIGLFGSISRIALYYTLIPTYSGIGAALAFTLGSLLSLIVSLLISRNHVIIKWRQVSLIFFTPMLFSFLLSSIDVHFIPVILTSLVFSYLALLKLRVIVRNDVQDTLAVLPISLGEPVVNMINKIGRKLNKNY